MLDFVQKNNLIYSKIHKITQRRHGSSILRSKSMIIHFKGYRDMLDYRDVRPFVESNL